MSEMSDDPKHVPLGDTGAFVDFSKPVMTLWKVEESQISDICFEKCNPVAVVNELAQMAIANSTMDFWHRGGDAGEQILHLRVNCKGPKKRFLRGTFCGIRVKTETVALPVHPTETESDS